MASWYLIYTKPKNEDIVTNKFLARGFDLFNPKIKERRYLRRRLQTAVSPLFPCYIFARFNMKEHLQLVKYTRGVRNIIGTDGVPSAVPEEIIRSIREKVEQNDGFITITPPEFEQGEELFVKNGPLQGMEAVFLKKLKGVERVSILLKAINARAIVDSRMLAKN